MTAGEGSVAEAAVKSALSMRPPGNTHLDAMKTWPGARRPINTCATPRWRRVRIRVAASLGVCRPPMRGASR